MIYDFVEGATNKERFRLKDDGVAVPRTGLPVPVLDLFDKDGAPVTTTGAVAWADAAASDVDVDMEVLALTAAKSPYRARLWLTDQVGDRAPYPNTEKPDIWRVAK